jgi:serine phosphatase RsbU (regulator of sigma subunit)
MRTCLLYLLIGILSSAQAQNLDSLQGAWQNPANTKDKRLDALYQLAVNYQYRDADSALALSRSLLSQAKQWKSAQYEMMAYSSMGVCKYFKGDFPGALADYQQAMKLAEKAGDKRRAMIVNSNIGLIYEETSQHGKAIDHYLKSKVIAEETGDSMSIAAGYGNLANVYQDKGDTELALDYNKRALAICAKLGFEQGMANCYNNIGTIHYKLGNYLEAIEHYRQSLGLSEKLEDNLGIISSSENIGMALSDLGQYDEAIRWCEKALGMAVSAGSLDDRKASCKCLYKAYSGKGNYKKALEYHEEFIRHRDSLVNEDRTREIAKREVQFVFEKKAAADSVKNAEEKKVKDSEIKAQRLQLKQEQTQRYALYGGLGLVILFTGLVYNRFRVTRRQKTIIEEKKREVEEQKNIVEEKNNDITQSIRYARFIQRALLPGSELLNREFSEAFVLYLPKDIVSGDFYWVSRQGSYVYYATADCTGHGVPGGFISMLGISLLNEIINDRSPLPGEVLTIMREKIIQALRQEGGSGNRDGMDIVLCRIDTGSLEMKYAAANNSMYHYRNGELAELGLDKMPVGVFTGSPVPFNTYTLQLQQGDVLYSYSDGYPDQFGGEKGKKLTYKKFREQLVSIAHLPLDKQHDELMEAFTRWKGNNEQVDDVCVLGVKI